MNNQTVYLKKEGRLLTLFIDPATNLPVPYTRWGDDPPQAFPQSFFENELAAKIGPGTKVVFVEEPRQPNPISQLDPQDEAAAETQYQSYMQGVQAPAPEPEVPASEPARGGADYSQLLAAFAALPEEDVEAVGSFLIGLDPSLEEALRRARQPHPPAVKKRFRLGSSGGSFGG